MNQQNQTYAQRYFEASLDFFEQGQHAKALEHIQKAIEKVPNNPDYYYTKGTFYHKMNNLIMAIQAYREVLNVAPNYLNAHFNLGLIFMKNGKIAEAIRSWEAVVRLAPDDIDANFNIAVAMTQLGRPKDAVTILEKILKLRPDHVQAHQNLGILYRDAGNFAKAKFHLAKLRELDSTYTELVNREIARCVEEEFLAQANKQDISGIAKQLRFNDGEQVETKLGEALQLSLTGGNQAALTLIEQVLAAVPSHGQARFLRGQVLAGLDRRDEAITELLGLLQDQPDNNEARFYLGNLFLDLGERERALEEFTKVRELDADYPLIEENISNAMKKG